MDDDKIKDLFSDFQPELSSSFQFMTRLQKNMEAVEIVRQHNAAMKKRNRTAVIIAALSGFVMGVILTLLFPLIEHWISTLNITFPLLDTPDVSIEYNCATWIIMAGVSVLTAVNVYEIALAKLYPNKIHSGR